jgi:hypothetical protein
MLHQHVCIRGLESLNLGLAQLIFPLASSVKDWLIDLPVAKHAMFNPLSSVASRD